ncbi:MAG TPA: NAD(P)-binding domain-containing protein [Solirubrobacter sp.]|nr:NAD(P)-binding domain-containing protein [Solirubrobacter sp.]
MTPIHREVVVIGGGQAGLAIGHFLAEQGRDFTILEAADAPAAAWRERWDSLRLFTSARYNSLPGKPFPGDPDRYPTRDEVVAYLTDYASGLPVELSSRVRRLTRSGSSYRVELDDREYEADQVVVATGPFQTPRIPAFAAGLADTVHQLHSTGYRNAAQIPDGLVLVVGGGNTGYQIAEELTATHEVHLAVGSRQTPMPQRLFGRDIFRFLDAFGALTASVDTRIGRRMQGRETLVGSSPRRARRQGIRVHPRATGARGSTVTFVDGTQLDVTTVIWATGFALDHAWIDVPVFAPDGTVLQRRGVTPSPGLYFLGLPWMHSRGSALLGWVQHDASYIAARIALVSASTSPRVLTAR